MGQTQVTCQGTSKMTREVHDGSFCYSDDSKLSYGDNDNSSSRQYGSLSNSTQPPRRRSQKETTATVRHQEIREETNPPPVNRTFFESTRTTASMAVARDRKMHPLSIIAMLCPAFSNGTVMTTLFLLTLPIECKRIETQTMDYNSFTISKSLALGGFAAIGGLTQLINPLMGMISDNYIPKSKYPDLVALGNRIPYIIISALFVAVGFAGMMYTSAPIHPIYVHHSHNTTTNFDEDTSDLGGSWFAYTIFYTINFLGLNVLYTITLTFIPDLIPSSQIGVANGTLALMLVLGSLFGFAMFYLFLNESVMEMYKMYIGVSLASALITSIAVMDRRNTLRIYEQQEIDRQEVFMHQSINTTDLISSPSVVTSDIEDGEEEDYESLQEQEAMSFSSSFFSQFYNFRQQEGSTSCWINTSWPQLHTLIYDLFYEPICNKTASDILSVYWLDITKHHDFFFVTISRFFYYMGISSQTFFLYFIHDALQRGQAEGISSDKKHVDPEAAVALLAIVGQAAGAVTCYPVGVISDQYFDKRRKPFVYFACVILALSNISLLGCTTLSQMLTVGSWWGAANGMYLTMDTSLAVDTLRDNEIIGDDDDGDGVAQMLGVWGVFGFVGATTGPLIGGIALLVFGQTTSDNDDVNAHYYYSSASQSMYSNQQYYSHSGYVVLFSLSAFYFFCSAVSLNFVQRKNV